MIDVGMLSDTQSNIVSLASATAKIAKDVQYPSAMSCPVLLCVSACDKWTASKGIFRKFCVEKF
jgi:hypothetical protein